MNRTIYVFLFAVFCSCTRELPEQIGNTSTSTNLPPVAIAGPDMTITLPDTSYVILDGRRSYDPDGQKLTYNWVQVFGPSTVSFHNNYTRPGDAFVGFISSGKYLFKLTAEDDKFSVSDTVEIIVKWASDCNDNREMVSVETVSVGVSPKNISYAPGIAIGQDLIVFAGGVLTEPFWADDPPATYASLVHVYDVRSNAWSFWELLQPKSSMSAVIAGNKLFLGGGIIEGGITDEVEIHDLTKRKADKANLSLPRINLSVATAANKVVFAGGSNKDGIATDAVDIYDLSTNSWSTAKLSQPRMNMSVMVNGNHIYFVGGASTYDGGSSNAVDIFDAASGSWSVKRISRSGRHLQTALFGNKMVVAGGTAGPYANASTRVEFVDLTDWSSTFDCLLNTSYSEYGPRGENLNVAVIGDKIYFGSNEFIGMYNNGNKLWKHARVENHYGLLFGYQEKLYGFRYAYSQDGKGQYQVIRIEL